MSFLREQIGIRRDQLRAQMKMIKIEFRELERAELALGEEHQVQSAADPPAPPSYESEPSELGAVANAPSTVGAGHLFKALAARTRRKTHWQMVRSVLQHDPTLDVHGIAQRVLEQFGVAIRRETLSVELSRWSCSGRLKKEGRSWILDTTDRPDLL
jgi:hypothetical protein